MSIIYENYMDILERMKRAALKAGRSPDDITVIGVTKNVDTQKITDFLTETGNPNIAENKVQELLRKQEEIGDKAIWHLIGHLQTNKVKQVVGRVKLIQSVDSYRLAAEIDKRAREINSRVDILVEVNIAGEANKYGISPSECGDFVAELLNFDGISVKGLMTVAPFVENQEENRSYFRKMKNLFVDIQDKFVNNIGMEFLSMGMTNDFETAVEEGSNMLRIGTGIFGIRDYIITR